MIGNAEGIGNFEFDAIATVDINSQKVFRDVAFSWSKRFSIAGLATVDIVIDPQAIAPKIGVVLPITFKAIGAGPINIDFYFGTDSDDDGTLWSGGNRDNRSSTPTNTVVRLSPTINSDGTRLPFEFLLMSNGTAAVATVGGEAKDDLIFIPRLDGKYMFRLINTENAVAQCSFAMTIFEAEIGK